MSQVHQDTALAFRSLRRHPGFSIAVILTLALGVAAVTSVASVAYSVLLAPLPIHDAARVVELWGDNPNRQPAHFPLSGEEFRAFTRETKSFSAVAAMDYQATLPRLVQLGDTAVTIPSALVTGSFFEVLGARPLIGRLLRPDDDRYGAPFAAVISEHLWRTMYGADPNIVGTTTRFYIREMTIVGVVAGNLDFPRGAELWASAPNYSRARDTLPGFFDVIARLAPGASAAAARAELGAFLARPDEPHSGARRIVGQFLRPAAVPILERIVGDVRPVFAVVAGAVVLLLVATCFNIASLTIVRTLAQRREFAVRAALGAGRARIARQTLIDSMVRCALGGTLGILGSWIGVRLFVAYAASTIPRAGSVRIQLPALAATLALCVVVAILFAAIPATMSGRLSLSAALAERGEARSARAQWMRSLLVSAQVTVAIITLAAAGVIGRNFARLAHDDLGFAPEHLIVARFGQTATLGDLKAWNDAVERAIARVRQVPGVTHAAPLLVTPFRATGNDLGYSLAGDTPGAAMNRPMADYLGADPDYFKTMGITLRQGRAFTSEDRAGSARVAVVDELLAKQAWPRQNPICQQIGVGPTFYTVVGVVESTRYRDLLAPRATLYTPFAQAPLFSESYLAIRTSTNPAAVTAAVRRAVRETDARLFLADFATMGDRIEASLVTARVSALLLSAFAFASLALTGIGLYAVVATLVRQRRFEIGVRIALGATPDQIAKLILAHGMVVVGTGAAVGLSCVLVFGRALESLTYVTTPRDPIAVGLALAAIGVVTAAALFMPTRRAARTNPADVLRGL
jgi:putative ABC transport system permease protein